MTAPASPPIVISNLWRKIPRHIKITFFTAIAVGIVVHAFMLTNKLPNHDDLAHLFSAIDFREHGRWFLTYPGGISGLFSMPWVNGVLAILYIAVAACLVVSCLNMRQSIYCALTAAMMVSFPVVAGTLNYMQWADAFFFCMMLACLAAFLASRYKYGYIAGIAPLVLSLGGYQAYFGVAVTLLLIVLIFEILQNQTPWKKTLFKGLRFLGMLGVSMALYLIIVRLTTPETGLTSYMGVDKIGQIPLSELPRLIVAPYILISLFFRFDPLGFHYPFIEVIFFACACISAALVALWCARTKLYKEPIKLALLVVLLALFPVGCFIVALMNPSDIHALMIYSVVMVPIFALNILDAYANQGSYKPEKTTHKMIVRAKRLSAITNLACWAVTAAISLCVFTYFVFSNEVYLKQFITYETAFAYSTELVTRIRETEDYAADSMIVFVGHPRYNPKNQQLEDIQLTGAQYDFLSDATVLSGFLEYYLNFTQPRNFSQTSDLANTAEGAILANMPSYPGAGSIAVIQDKIYVKLSD